MLQKALFLSAILFLSTPSFAAISGKMMQFASQHRGHLALENHEFIKSLREGTFRREQIARFFQDRVYLLKILEERFKTEREIDSELLPTEQEIFFRSEAYHSELRYLMGRWSSIDVSESAIRYGEYLQNGTAEVIAIHLWLFLVGETFGIQPISKYINAKYKNVGGFSKEFGGLSLMSVRSIYNQWINHQFAWREVAYEKEIDTAYGYLVETFDAAWATPQVSFCKSTMTVLSEQSYLKLGY